MPLIGRYRSDRLVGVHAYSAARIADALRNPTKQQLRDELAEAVRNTAKLPTQTKGDTDASDH